MAATATTTAAWAIEKKSVKRLNNRKNRKKNPNIFRSSGGAKYLWVFFFLFHFLVGWKLRCACMWVCVCVTSTKKYKVRKRNEFRMCFVLIFVHVGFLLLARFIYLFLPIWTCVSVCATLASSDYSLWLLFIIHKITISRAIERPIELDVRETERRRILLNSWWVTTIMYSVRHSI